MSEMPPGWEPPVPEGDRLAWFDGERTVYIPVLWVRSMHVGWRSEDLMNGYHAQLPTENGTHIDLTYDPEYEQPLWESSLSQWLYVDHPDDGHIIGARVRDGKIEYDPRCRGAHCTAHCAHDWGSWWSYVFTPAGVLENLAWLGSLPVVAV